MCDMLIALADNNFCLGTFYRLFMKSELGRERMLALHEHSKCVGQSNQYQCCISWKSCHLLEDLSYPFVLLKLSIERSALLLGPGGQEELRAIYGRKWLEYTSKVLQVSYLTYCV